MADLVNASAQAIADALAPTPQAPAARWRWGSVVSVNADGTMNVSIGGATVPGIRAACHAMTAQVGDRVRVMYCGTECMVDAVRATAKPAPEVDLLHFEETESAETSIASGACVEVNAPVPAVAGYTRRGIVQTWTTGTGNTICGSQAMSGMTAGCKVRANSASTVVVHFYIMYVRDSGGGSSGGGDAPEYTGQTVFTPSETTQTAQTAGMVLNGNITINPIPSDYGHVEYDGSTLTIS